MRAALWLSVLFCFEIIGRPLRISLTVYIVYIKINGRSNHSCRLNCNLSSHFFCFFFKLKCKLAFVSVGNKLDKEI